LRWRAIAFLGWLWLATGDDTTNLKVVEGDLESLLQSVLDSACRGVSTHDVFSHLIHQSAGQRISLLDEGVKSILCPASRCELGARAAGWL